MSILRRYTSPVGLLAVGFAVFAFLAGVAAVQAQTTSAMAEIARVTGRVEILRQGQTQWIPAAAGLKLAERDEIRAFAGALAELKLPDTSTIVLAENSRLVVTRLEFDRRAQTRNVVFHLAVGKVRAAVAKATLALVLARQSTFAISTPTAVAAARGTILAVEYQPGEVSSLEGGDKKN